MIVHRDELAAQYETEHEVLDQEVHVLAVRRYPRDLIATFPDDILHAVGREVAVTVTVENGREIEKARAEEKEAEAR